MGALQQHAPVSSSAASWSASRAVGSVVQLLSKNLAAAQDLDRACACLNTALALFSDDQTDGPPPAGVAGLAAAANTEAADTNAGPTGASLAHLSAQLAPHVAALGWPAVRHMFYEQQFGSWSCAVLTGREAPHVTMHCGLHGRLFTVLYPFG